MFKGICRVFVQNGDVDIHPIKSVELRLQLVVAREHLLAHSDKNSFELGIKIGNIDELAFLFRKLIKL